MRELVVVVLGTLLLSACEQKKETPKPLLIEPATTPAKSAVAALPRPATHGGARALGVSWSDVPGLTKLSGKRPMRAASYQAPAADGDKEPGDLGVFYFGADEGGGVESNMKRWVGQFPGTPKERIRRSQRTENGLLQHIVEVDGEKFMSGVPGGPKTPKDKYAMIAFIVEAPSGLYFFKLTGPQATVEKAKEPLFSMMKTVQVK